MIDARLQALTGELEPIRQTTERLVDQTAKVDPLATLLISHRAAIGTQAYAIVLFAGVSDDLIADYEQLHVSRAPAKFAIPEAYRAILRALNGAHIYQMSLYGLPVSMSRDPPLLNRSVRQPLDLATANSHWKTPYAPNGSQFHFGSGPFSDDENLGYFLNPDGSIEARRVGGEGIGTWTSMTDFLAQEVVRFESLYPSYESNWSEFLRKLEAKNTASKPKKK